jgi:16S rRNA processing protein RimM
LSDRVPSVSPIRVVVGRIGRAHGIRGDVAVDVRTDEPERRFARGAVLAAGSRKLTVASSRWHSGRLVVSFAEVADRTAAEQLRGIMLEIDVDPGELPSDDDAYYDRQLIGLEAITDDGSVIGVVASVVHHDEQDTLIVAADGRELMIPFVSAIVPTVDLGAGHLVVADVPGLLDPSAAETVADSTGTR